ncbi:hypothetical protein [Roseovarius indicus]|uniref:hypothetical protein n=1 Tax=Roseovarius indicus TaxID=540747 RepID=UPI000AA81F52
MFKSLKLLGLVACVAGVGMPGQAEELSFSGELSLTARYYEDDGLFFGQPSSGTSYIPEGRFGFRTDLGFAEAEFEVYGRADSRTGSELVDIQKAYLLTGGDRWSVLVGSDIVFWGVAESYNPVNIINQNDNFGRFDETRKLGQPMVNVNYESGALGTFSFYGLFGFREPDLGTTSSRPRFIVVPDDDVAIFEKSSDKIDFAFRNTNTVGIGNGSLDYAVSYFNGTDRTPVFLPGCANRRFPVSVPTCNAVNRSILASYAGLRPGSQLPLAGQVFLNAPLPTQLFLLSGASVGAVPYYQEIEQVGVELAYATGNWVWKFEGAQRFAQNEDYFLGVAGVEYRFNQAFGTPGALTLAAEYTYDDRSNLQPFTVFDDDVFVSARYDFNNRLMSSITLSGLFDMGNGGDVYMLDISSRLTDSTQISFSATQVDFGGFFDPLSLLTRDDYYELKLTYFF